MLIKLLFNKLLIEKTQLKVSNSEISINRHFFNTKRDFFAVVVVAADVVVIVTTFVIAVVVV